MGFLDFKEHIPNLEQLKDIVLAEHNQEIDWSAYLVDQIPEQVEQVRPQPTQTAEIIQLPTQEVANVAITGTTKNPEEDLALQRVFEIHDDIQRAA